MLKKSIILKENAAAAAKNGMKKVALKADDFANKDLYKDYLYDVETLQGRVYAYKACTDKKHLSAVYAAIDGILSTWYDVDDAEKTAVMNSFKHTDFFQSVKTERGMTRESRAAVKEAAAKLAAVENRRVTETYTAARKAADVAAAKKALDAVPREYKQELFSQTSVNAFRLAFENNVGYILADAADKVSAAFLTAEDKRILKKAEESDRWMRRAEECNKLGANIDASKLIADDDGGLKKLKAAVQAFFAAYTAAQAAAVPTTNATTDADTSAA